jgi:hypothetical protein
MDDLLDDLLDPDDEYDPAEIGPSFPKVHRGGESLPDLELIPEAQWEEALRPLTQAQRRLAVDGVGTSGTDRLHGLLLRLAAEDERRLEVALERSAPPDVGPLPRSGLTRREVRQVSFRLSPAEHQDLQRAASFFGVSCARLARMLTIRGVRRALTDP